MKGVIQQINVSATLKSMEVGTSVFLDSGVNENTLRHACVRLRTVTGGAWKVQKIVADRKHKGYSVTRTA